MDSTDLATARQDGSTLARRPGERSTPVTTLCYSSRPIPGFEQCRLRKLVQQARRANAQAGVTGALFFDGRRILQVLEGEESALDALFARIQHDPRHERISVLWRGPAHRREFERQPLACYNLAWRRMQDRSDLRLALDGMFSLSEVELSDIVSLARMVDCLNLPVWPEPLPH